MALLTFPNTVALADVGQDKILYILARKKEGTTQSCRSDVLSPDTLLYYYFLGNILRRSGFP